VVWVFVLFLQVLFAHALWGEGGETYRVAVERTVVVVNAVLTTLIVRVDLALVAVRAATVVVGVRVLVTGARKTSLHHGSSSLSQII
jgi:hypothetical protein